MKISRETKIGITGVVALVALFLGINFLKGMNLFSQSDVYYIAFSNAKGLTKSSAVYADGFNVGIVSDISYDRPGQVVVEISTDESLRIPKGSTAQLDEAMLGGCTLNMLLATNLREAYQPGDTIPGTDANGLMQKAADMMPQVELVVAKVDTLISSLNTLLANPNLPLILENAELITENLNRSTQQLDRILSKDLPQLTATYTAAGQNITDLTAKLNGLDLQATLDSVTCTISNVNQMMTAIQNPNGTVGRLLNDDAVYRNLDHTIQSADSLLTDMKSRPGRYVHFSVFGKKQK